ncbi:MAG: ISAs1 family transposase, partial [Chloroflexi bacterium]|nr:ISAs1 family transposase [Chloroflexota bacterium]
MDPCHPCPSLVAHFASLDDPRVDRTKLHPLLSIVVIAICAVIGGAESGDDIELFGQAQADWFAPVLDLPHRVPSGCPSHATFNRVFVARGTLWVPQQFRACFQRGMQAVAGVLPARVLARDGTVVRRSHGHAGGKRALPLVSAWATANRLVLAQTEVDETTQRVPGGDRRGAAPSPAGPRSRAPARGRPHPAAPAADQGGEPHRQEEE